MITHLPQREPFDEEDAATARRYLRSRKLTEFDPFAAETAAQDVIFTNSLAVARQMIGESFRTATTSGRAFRCYPVFADSSSPNAFAIDYEGLQICGVHVGLVPALFEIGLVTFSQAALFPELGDPSRERSPSLPEGAALSFWMSDRLRADPVGEGKPVGVEFLPQDDRRGLAAHYLTQLMLRFAWLHELFHCPNGHTGLKAGRFPKTALNEMPDYETSTMVETAKNATDPQWRLVEHCMEFDADRTALWAMMRMQGGDGEPIKGLGELPRQLRLKLVIFACMMMTFLFDQAARRHDGASSGTHPLPYHRLHNLVRTLASSLLDSEGMTKVAFAEVLTEVTRLRERVPELFSPAQLLHDLRDSDLQAAFDRIGVELEAARAQFAPYAFQLAPAF